MDALKIFNKQPENIILSRSFITRYLPNADGTSVKVYLYLLDCCTTHKKIDLPDIASFCHISPSDVEYSLNYWAKNGLLELSYKDGQIESVAFLSCHEENSSTDYIWSNPIKEETTVISIDKVEEHETKESYANELLDVPELNVDANKTYYTAKKVEEIIDPITRKLINNNYAATNAQLNNIALLMDPNNSYKFDYDSIENTIEFMQKTGFSLNGIIKLVETWESKNIDVTNSKKLKSYIDLFLSVDKTLAQKLVPQKNDLGKINLTQVKNITDWVINCEETLIYAVADEIIAYYSSIDQKLTTDHFIAACNTRLASLIKDKIKTLADYNNYKPKAKKSEKKSVSKATSRQTATFNQNDNFDYELHSINSKLALAGKPTLTKQEYLALLEKDGQ